MAAIEPEGGDPACWLDQVCDRCGRFVERPADHDCEADDRPPDAPGPAPAPRF